MLQSVHNLQDRSSSRNRSLQITQIFNTANNLANPLKTLALNCLHADLYYIQITYICNVMLYFMILKLAIFQLEFCDIFLIYAPNNILDTSGPVKSKMRKNVYT